MKSQEMLKALNFISFTIFTGEIILDDLSFDILEALKNVDEDKEQDESSISKKRKTRNSYSNRTREVVVDEDSDEEYTPPKVRFSDKKLNQNSWG